VAKDYFNGPFDLADILNELRDRIDQLEQGNNQSTGANFSGGAVSVDRATTASTLFKSGTSDTGIDETVINSRTGGTPVLRTGETGALYPFMTYAWTPASLVTATFASTSYVDLFEFRGVKFNEAIAVNFWVKATADTPNTSADFRVVDRLNADALVQAYSGGTVPTASMPTNTAAYLIRTFNKSFAVPGDVGARMHYVLQGRLTAGLGPCSTFMDRVVGAAA